jgi:hypothetical protein
MNEPTGWERLTFFFGQSVAGGLSMRLFDSLLGALLSSQEEEVALLQSIEAKVDRLLSADAMAAAAHLRHALLPGRTEASRVEDVRKARDLFVRAIGQTASGLESAIMRRNVAVCSAALGDPAIVNAELKLAKEDATRWEVELEIGIAEPTRKETRLHRQTNAYYFGGKFAMIPGLIVLLAAPAVFIAGAGAYGYAYYRKVREAGAAALEVSEQKELTTAFQRHIVKLQAVP